MVEPSGGGLRGVPVAPVPGRQSPAHLDLVGMRRLPVQAAHTDEHPVRATLDGQQAVALPGVALLRPRGDVVGVLAAQGSSEVIRDQGIRVQRRVERKVVPAERAADQALGRHQLGARPLDHLSMPLQAVLGPVTGSATGARRRQGRPLVSCGQPVCGGSASVPTSAATPAHRRRLFGVDVPRPWYRQVSTAGRRQDRPIAGA